MSFYVYTYSDPRSSEIFYVGKGTGDRWRRHLTPGGSHSEHLDRKIKKMLREGVEPVVEVTPCVSEIAAFEAERFLIACMGRQSDGSGPLVNVCAGGEGAAGRVLPPEARARISAAKKGKPFSEEHRAALRAARAKALTPEYRAEIGRRARERITPEGRARISAAGKLKRHTDEFKAAHSARFKGRAISAEQRAQISKTLAGHSVSEATRAKIRATLLARNERTAPP